MHLRWIVIAAWRIKIWDCLIICFVSKGRQLFDVFPGQIHLKITCFKTFQNLMFQQLYFTTLYSLSVTCQQHFIQLNISEKSMWIDSQFVCLFYRKFDIFHCLTKEKTKKFLDNFSVIAAARVFLEGLHCDSNFPRSKKCEKMWKCSISFDT